MHTTHYAIFGAQQHTAYMLSALYAIARPSVCLSVTREDQSNMVEVRIINSHHTVVTSL